MRRLACVIMVFIVGLPGAGWAISGKGTTAATFLKIGVGPRAVAMGEAFAAVADDSSAVHWNPAGLAQLDTPQITAMHVFWFQDMFYDHLSGALPLPAGVGGLSLVYLNLGELSRSDASDQPEDPSRGQFTAADLGFTAAYGFDFSAAMRLGAGLKVFSETIDSQSSLGWGLDLAFLYQLPWPGATFAAVMQNLGPATSVADDYFRLPLNFKVGFAYRPLAKLLLALDYNQLLEQYGKISLGAEYWFEDRLALRLGYQYQEKTDPSELYSELGSSGVAGLTAGLGVKYLNFRLDYAFVPYGLLGSTHRVAVTYLLPGMGK